MIQRSSESRQPADEVTATKTLCWSPIWREGFENCGLEYVVVSGTGATSTLLAVDEDGLPFRLTYQLEWDRHYRIRQADFEVHRAGTVRHLNLRADGAGRWHQAAGPHLSEQPSAHLPGHLPALDGCIDIDIWPTPLTNSFPIWRGDLQIGQRQEFRMAWVSAPALTVEPKPQAYTRMDERLYGFESLDSSGFRAELTVDDDGVVLDYPGLFRRVSQGG